MNISHLKYVDSVVKYGTMREAAKHLFVTEPTISQQIRALEQNLKFPIFEKKGRNVILTPEGVKLLPSIKKILAAIHDAEKLIEEIQNPLSGQVRLGLGPIMAARVLPSFFKEFTKIYPHIIFNVFQGGSVDLIDMLISSKIDVGLVTVNKGTKEFLETNKVFWKDLFKVKYVAVVSENHRLAQNENISIKELASEPFFLYHKSMVRETLLLTFGPQFSKNIVGSFDSYDTIRDLVKAGIGVSILAETYVNDLPFKEYEGLHVIEFQDMEFSLDLCCIYKEDGYIPQYIEEVIEIVLKVSGEQIPL
ncbi:LysR family transcriptional regulator [Sporosarcina soli]|uniref:LysR family transcriptional regulator n=1 Tax=Sporosarcina soli TaxID=334736 RepID=A0ABW0TID8_9BACL